MIHYGTLGVNHGQPKIGMENVGCERSSSICAWVVVERVRNEEDFAWWGYRKNLWNFWKRDVGKWYIVRDVYII